MPNLDRTGPEGQGPKTGRVQGRCKDTTNTSKSPLGPRSEMPSRRRRLRDGSGLGRRLNRRRAS